MDNLVFVHVYKPDRRRSACGNNSMKRVAVAWLDRYRRAGTATKMERRTMSAEGTTRKRGQRADVNDQDYTFAGRDNDAATDEGGTGDGCAPSLHSSDWTDVDDVPTSNPLHLSRWASFCAG